MASTQHSHITLPPDPGDKIQGDEAHFSSVPIRVVTNPSELPAEFLEPSPETKLVIGFDCEGVDLCRHGTLCIMQLAFPDAIYLVDAIQGGETVIQACKPALESNYITKVIHDCKRDSEALYFQFGIKLHNVVDTQIAYSLINEQEGHARVPDDYISFVGLLADPRYCGVSYDEKEEVRVLLRQDPKYWTYRPLSEQMTRAAADDVRFLLYIYHKMVQKLNNKSLWHLAVRGALYCRCFCISDNNFADWPPLPPIPENIVAGENIPEEEILSVVDVPPGKMGRVIGRKGASILSIKELNQRPNQPILILIYNGMGEQSGTHSRSTCTIESTEGVNLEGRVYRPNNSNSTVVAVLVHPYSVLGGCQGLMRGIAKGLASGGVIAVTFDTRGAGKSNGRASFTGSAEINDVISVCKWVTTNFSTNRIILIGSSAGAAIAGSAVDQVEQVVGYVSLGYPFGFTASILFGRHQKYILQSPKPKLFVMGTNDGFTSVKQLENKLKDAAGHNTTHLIQGATHFQMEGPAFDADMVNLILQFITTL